ncbi:hypothetical protein A0J61_01364 [Choanephora cucurbitarum]|uniref:BZIP domain-containing protein n=1 Tax=Choanephora cucurbitarum TaxID=101091 RepID=A0A1C7NNX4_9FUNG|nr:hypothetical protein A0J61_01364 [Choanephora cucurbitarum]
MTCQDTPNTPLSLNASLDEWLEDDLQKSNLIDKPKNKPCSLQNIVLQENKTPSLKHIDIPSNDAMESISMTNVISLLCSIRQNEQLIKDRQFLKRTPVNNTKKRKTKCLANTPDLKRQRNTDAARRSRERKAIKMATLETQVDGLKKENGRLRVKVAVLESEVNYAVEKEKLNRQRVLELEAQLANAHQRLVTGYVLPQNT